MIAQRVSDVRCEHAFVELDGFAPSFTTYLKLEGLNPTGSIKVKTAGEMLSDAEQRGLLGVGMELIESTSGNIGVALASLCAAKGHRITLVTDPNANQRAVQHMRALGADVVVIDERDENNGYVHSRIAYIQRQLAINPKLLWLNQYASPANVEAHRRSTAQEILDGFGAPDWLFVGAGTGGTLMGCVRGLRSAGAHSRIVAVDAVGSVTFGNPPGTRWIPGIGNSRRPEIITDDSYETTLIHEVDAVRVCRWVARRYGLLLGGSTGAALAAVAAAQQDVEPGSRVLVISPDLGVNYLDTVFDDEWVLERFGPTALDNLSSPDRPPVATWDGRPIKPLVDPSAQVDPSKVQLRMPAEAIPSHHKSASSDSLSVLTGRQVVELLAGRESEVIEVVREAYLTHDAGDSDNPDSSFLALPGNSSGRIIALPAYLGGSVRMAGIKWIGSVPANVQTGRPRASALLVLNNVTTGYPLVVMAAAAISAARTAALAALATRTLAHQLPTSIGVVGSGLIARTVLQYLMADGATPREVYCHDLDSRAARGLADEVTIRGATGSPATIGVVADQGRALSSAVVIFATTQPKPHIDPSHRFSPDQLVLHISLRDLAVDTLLAANNVLDDVNHCLKANSSPHLAEQATGNRRFVDGTLADALHHRLELRTDRPTIFSPFGLGVLDVAVAADLYNRAAQRGLLATVTDFFETPS